MGRKSYKLQPEKPQPEIRKIFAQLWQSDIETRAQRGAGFMAGDNKNSAGQSPKLPALS